MSIVFRKMNEREITQIYETRMTEDFPPMELKPLHSMIDMMEQGIYECLLVYDEEPIGYACVLLPEGISYGLLDYLGTFSEKRNAGYGSQVLQELAGHYQDRVLMIESEYPDDAPDKTMAERRLRFYRRNGAADTGVESRVFGAHYVNLMLSGRQKDEPCALPSAEDMKGEPCALPSEEDMKGESCALPSEEDMKGEPCALPSAEEVKEVLAQLYAAMLPDVEKRRKYLEFWIA